LLYSIALGGETLNKQIKKLRKTLALNQEEFGARLGLTGSGISKIESGTNTVTEQVIKAIVREYNVDRLWLSTGEGEMFNNVDDCLTGIIDDLLHSENDTAKKVFKAFAAMSEEDWHAVKRFIERIKKES